NNLNPFLATNALKGTVAPSASYANLASKTTAGGTLVGTEAIILAGRNVNTITNVVSMNWRDRADIEKPPTATHPPILASSQGLVSDIVELTGMNKKDGLGIDNGQVSSLGDRHETDAFALQMSYNPALLPSGVTEADIALAGNLYLGWLDTEWDGVA